MSESERAREGGREGEGGREERDTSKSQRDRETSVPIGRVLLP